jgi:hypothetical protein
MKPSALAVVVAACLVACAHPVRFGDRAILWRDPDDAPVPMPSLRPAPPGGRLWPGANNAIFRPADRLLNVDYGREAVNVNALDEVPTSSWYEDPRRDPDNPAAPPRALSSDELERGVRRDEPAEPPFVIVSGLDGGSADGFIVEDARGRRFVLKLDPEGHPGLVTGADAVATRLAWASGWRVPADDTLDVARDQLRVRPGATMANQYGQREPLGEGDVDSVLRHAARGADGRYRAVTSRWIEGHVLGPVALKGRDLSDGNDRYAHEDRRDLRGFGVWAAWVDDIDVIENNTLDSYVGERGRGHVVHYQLDVGGSFGGFSAAPAHYWMGDQSYFQPGRIVGSLLTLGLVPYRWEDARWQRRRRALVEQYPELGGYSAQHFELRAWRPIVDVPAFVRQTRRDRYWGAKRVAAFSRDEVAAAVAAGRYRPAAAAYLTEALWQRRTRIAVDAFGETAPLDHVAVAGARLCFVDLWVRAGLGGGEATDYRAQEDERDIAATRGAAGDGNVCVTLPARDGYRVVALAARRPGERRFGGRVEVHLMAHGGGARVLGVVH